MVTTLTRKAETAFRANFTPRGHGRECDGYTLVEVGRDGHVEQYHGFVSITDPDATRIIDRFLERNEPQ